MKTFFSLVLINLIIFGYSLPAYLTDERTKKSYERAKNLHSALRYLDEVVERVGSNEEAPTNKTEPVPEIKPSGSPTEKPTQDNQVLTYGNFKSKRSNPNGPRSPIKIEYSIIMYFLNKLPPKIVEIILRVGIITRRSRVRNLEETVEDVKTTCKLAGNNDGVAAYDCEGETKTEGSDVEGAKINTNEPMVLDGVPVPMSNVAFSEAAAEIGNNLHNSTITIDTSAKPYMLKEGKIADKTKNSFKVSGTINNFNHVEGDKFNFTFHNNKDGENIEVICTVDSKDGNNVVFKCPVNKPLNAIIDKAVGKYIGNSEDTVTFNFIDGGYVDMERSSSGGNKAYYRKNSSGLSGGAIAGIVIASAVALIVASVVAMMFRKSKPIENVSSTNVELNAPERF